MFPPSEGQPRLALRAFGDPGSASGGAPDRPVVLLTMGDPAGVGPEVALRAAATPELRDSLTLKIVGDPDVIAFWGERLGVDVSAEIVAGGARGVSVEPGSPSTVGAIASLESIEIAARLCLDGEADAMVTAPVSKIAIVRAGYEFIGHTEFLGALTGAEDVLMTFVAGGRRVGLVTTHVAVKRLPDLLSRRLIVGKLLLLRDGLSRLFGIEEPRIAVTGLNPHAGEGGEFGMEEREIIGPAIEEACGLGIQARGPYPADTIYHGLGEPGGRGPGSEFDAVLAMYHDQATIAAKLWGAEAVNLTVGLPIVRTSVNHGTAFDRAGGTDIDSGSMVAAVRLAGEIAGRVRGIALTPCRRGR